MDGIVLSYRRSRAFLISANEGAVTDDIGHKYRCKTAFNTFLGHMDGFSP